MPLFAMALLAQMALLALCMQPYKTQSTTKAVDGSWLKK